MKRLIVLLAMALSTGCSMPLTRATLTVTNPGEREIGPLGWQQLPSEHNETIKSVLDAGLTQGLSALPAERAREYRRYWLANRSFIFSVTHVDPTGAAATTSTDIPRKIVLVSILCLSGLPSGAEGSISNDHVLRLLIGGDDLPESVPSGAWSLRFGNWPELTGPPGTLGLWDPVRVQIEGRGSLRPIFGTGLVIDQATWDRLAIADQRSTISALGEVSSLQSTGFSTTANPLRWLLVPGTLLIDIFASDDDGERHRNWALNRWDFTLPR